MSERVVSILSSGMGLGVYNPTLIIRNRLKELGVKAEVFVIESYFINDKLEKLKENKKAFHQSFEVAVLGHKLIKGDIAQSLDQERMEKLLKYWKDHGRRDFIIASGHWTGIMDKFRMDMEPVKLNMDVMNMDSDTAPSWRHFKNEEGHFHEVKMFDFENRKINCRISIGSEPCIPYAARPNRFVLHGGGWGMGTYQSKIKELNEAGYALDIGAHEVEDIEKTSENNKYFLIDPGWAAWTKSENGEHEFPPVSEVGGNEIVGELKYTRKKEHHVAFDYCRRSKGIITKLGGGSMVDSLASATPAILLEPIAKHEQSNSIMWEELGLAISYEKWRETGYSLEVLEEIHNNLVARRESVKDYVEDFLYRYSINSAG